MHRALARLSAVGKCHLRYFPWLHVPCTSQVRSLARAAAGRTSASMQMRASSALQRVAEAPLRFGMHGIRWVHAASDASQPTQTASGTSGSRTVYRTMLCGDARLSYVGQTVTIAGFVQSVRSLGKITFVSLRDAYGLVQVVLTDAAAHAAGAELPLESIVQVEGVVQARAERARKASMHTGDVEVVASSITVLSKPSGPLPLQLKAGSASGSVSESVCESESVRLRYRYIDLRRDVLQQNLRARARILHFIRSFLTSSHPGFIEIETPTLLRSSPEGAREFVVPSRVFGLFYALAQSPQQWKQMLMSAGVDRYFQVARCYRDESGRADRQPEFTQIDMEMSFVAPEDVMEAAEGVFFAAVDALEDCVRSRAPEFRVFHTPDGKPAPGVPTLHIASPRPLPRMTFAHAMATYGSDKPDRRIGLPLSDITEIVLNTGAVAASKAGTPTHDTDLAQFATSREQFRALRVPGLAKRVSQQEMQMLVDQARSCIPSWTAGESSPIDVGCFFVGKSAQCHLQSWSAASITSALTPPVQAATIAHVDAAHHDAVFVVRGCGQEPCKALGILRILVAELCRHKRMTLTPHGTTAMLSASDVLPLALPLRELLAGAPLPPPQLTAGQPLHLDVFWVTDFPLFEQADDDPSRLQSCHHPFTSPVPEHADAVRAAAAGAASLTTLLNVRGQHYDLVVNGSEVAGGSIRIHNAALQAGVFQHILRLSESQQAGFSALLAALQAGTPPHGGIAFGLDRLVAILRGPAAASSIRDVIAFPKSAAGQDALTGAPAAVSAAQLAEYRIRSA